MPVFKLLKECLGKEVGEDVNMTEQRACLLMRSGYVKKNKSIMEKFASKIKAAKAKKKETAVSKKAGAKEKATK